MKGELPSRVNVYRETLLVSSAFCTQLPRLTGLYMMEALTIRVGRVQEFSLRKVMDAENMTSVFIFVSSLKLLCVLGQWFSK